MNSTITAAVPKHAAKIRPNFEKVAALAPTFTGWCAWQYVERPGKPKPGKAPSDGRRRISTNNPGEWITFDAARAAFQRGFDGLGILLTGNPVDVVGADIDDCLNDAGEIIAKSAVVEAMCAAFPYVEISPSGYGLRGFAYGLRPVDCAKQKNEFAEVYDTTTTGRYLTITGCTFRGKSGPVAQVDPAALANFLRVAKLIDEETDNVGGGEGEGDSGGDWPAKADDEIVDILKRNNKRGRVTRLMAGDSSDYAGQSEADAGLAAEALYYSNDLEQVCRIMRGTKLARDKWDERRPVSAKYGVEASYLGYTVVRVFEQIGGDGRASFWRDQAAKAATTSIQKAAARSQSEKADEYLVGGLVSLVGPKGKLANNVHVAAELLARDRRLVGAIFFDEFAMMPIASSVFNSAFGGNGGADGRALTDRDYRQTEKWLWDEWGIALRPGEIKRAVLGWADRYARNPVTERLDEFAAAWDGVPRLATMLADYFGVSSGDEDFAFYHGEIGIRFMVGVVARAYEPGAKVDTITVLEGAQGAKKSSGVMALAAPLGSRVYLEGFALDKLDKDARLALRGRVLGECAELDGMSRHEAGTLKNFLSSRTDHYRDPYGLATQDWPRTIVLVGTTNETSYLRDPTGNRRFWPVKVGRVDIKAIERDAALLWGEAVHRYRGGERWWIDELGEDDKRLREIQRREAAKRLAPDTWVEVIEEFNERLVQGMVKHPRWPDKIATPDEQFRVVDLMAAALQDEIKARSTIQEEIRFRTALARAGWLHNGSQKHGAWRLSAAARAEARERSR